MPLPPPPNQVYSAFSFIGFVLCAIPFYWHLEGTRNRFHVIGVRLPKNVRRSLEYRDMLVYVLDGPRVPGAMHQFDCVERKHDQ